MISLGVKSSIFLMILSALNIYGNEVSECSQREISNAYLDVAIDMISRAKINIPTCKSIDCPKIDCPKIDCPKIHCPKIDCPKIDCPKIDCPKIDCRKCQLRNASDCADIFQMGHNESGVYEVRPLNTLSKEKSFNVYCDMDTDGGGWTVIQRRGDFGKPSDFFYKDWESYKAGFGNIEQDFWLGNDKISSLTNQKQYTVRFDLKTFDQNERYAVYDNFRIDDEIKKYTLHISVYSGNAGDSMAYHNGQNFSTFDQDNDKVNTNCAVAYKGAWWYFGGACYHTNLNGPYHKEKYTHYDGIQWYPYIKESLPWTEIKIRPKNFKPGF